MTRDCRGLRGFDKMDTVLRPAVPVVEDTTTDVLGPWDEEADGPNPDDMTPAEYWQDVADDAAYERWREDNR